MTANTEATTGTQPEAEREGVEEGAEEPTDGLGRRVATTVAGGVLVGYGTTRLRSVRGVSATALGTYLLYSGVSGRSRGGVETTRRQRPRLETGASADAQSVERSITVLASPEELEERWRDPEHLSQVAGSKVAVQPAGDDRVRVTVEAPYGRMRTWQLHLADEEPGEALCWESTEAAIVPSEVAVEFEPAPGDRGTEVSVELRWDPPGGRLGAAVLERLGVVPASFATRALRRHKSLVETGEAPTLQGNPSARGQGDLV